MKLPDALLLLGASLRLTRFVITDDLGRWVIRRPAETWANRHDRTIVDLSGVRGPGAESTGEAAAYTLGLPPDPDLGWRSKLTSGLSCPFCVGFWIGVLLLVGQALFGRLRLWRFVLAALALNEVVGHISSRLGDAGYADDGEETR